MAPTPYNPLGIAGGFYNAMLPPPNECPMSNTATYNFGWSIFRAFIGWIVDIDWRCLPFLVLEYLLAVAINRIARKSADRGGLNDINVFL